MTTPYHPPYHQRPRITALAALFSLYLMAPGLLLADPSYNDNANDSLNEDYRNRYSLSKVDITENTHRQAEGRFELRGITEINSNTANPTKKSTKSATATLGSPLTATSSRQTDSSLILAQAFLNKNRELLGINNAATDLRLSTRETDRFGRQHLRYRRMIGALQLKNMEVILHISESGKVSGFNGNIVRISDDLAAEIQFLQGLGTLPKLTSARLLNLAAQSLKTDLSKLKLHTSQAFAINTSPYIIWEIEVSRPGQIGYDQLTLADTSGIVIHHKAPLRRHF